MVTIHLDKKSHGPYGGHFGPFETVADAQVALRERGWRGYIGDETGLLWYNRTKGGDRFEATIIDASNVRSVAELPHSN